MKKYLFTLLAVLLLILGACGEVEEEKQVESVEADEQNVEEVSEEEQEEKEDSKEIDKVIADNEHLKATLVDVVKVEDKEWDEERYEINIEIENKREDTIEVQAHEVSADGKMIDDFVVFSQTVAGEKSADGTMVIENYDGDLPEMEKELEFVLYVYSEDDYDFEDETDVKVEFN